MVMVMGVVVRRIRDMHILDPSNASQHYLNVTSKQFPANLRAPLPKRSTWEKYLVRVTL